MELFTLIVALVGFIFGLISLMIELRDIWSTNGYIKHKSFLKMKNGGKDLCKSKQPILLVCRYCQENNWITEES